LSNIKLHDYQEDAIAQIYEKLKRVKRIILWMQTGSGKSECAAYLAQAASKDGLPVLMVVRGRELVKNLSDRLSKYKIDHSVFMAGNPRLDKSKLIQICSIDTMKSRKEYPFSDRQALLILDEAHKSYDDVFSNYPIQFMVGLTATPFGDMSNFEDYTCPIESWELRDQGKLVPEKIYCPHVIDTSSLKIVAGDFKRDQVEQLVTNGEIVGNVIRDYIDLGEGRPAVCFAVSIEHSKQLRDEFIKQGVSAIHCDASSTDDERKIAQEQLENGTIKVLCNVDIFSVGWDCPMVSCVILARPTWSLIWYLQAVGRGLRSYPGKRDCIILDNAGNVFRHGTPYRPRDISLEKPDRKAKKRKDDISIRQCLECFHIYELPSIQCPECGAYPPAREIKKIEGILREYSETEEEKLARHIKEAQAQFYKLQWIARSKNLPPLWVKQQIEKKYGAKVMPYIQELLRIRSR
jgi:DNA repair protein RadD